MEDQATEQRPVAAKQPPCALTIAAGVALGIGAVIGVIWFIASLTSADNQVDCETENLDRVMNGQPALACP